jgi:ribosomal protein L29
MSMHKYIRDQKLRDKPVSELLQRASELKTQLFAHRFNRATGKLDNYSYAGYQPVAAVLIIREREPPRLKRVINATQTKIGMVVSNKMQKSTLLR